MTYREFLKQITPPILVDLIRRRRSGSSTQMIEWEYVAEGWAYASTRPEVTGWNVEDVLDTYQRKWPKFLEMTQGTVPLGIAHESALVSNEDINSHNTIMSFAYALTLAAHKLDSLSFLDWGGGIGHYYRLAQVLLPQVAIEYHCREAPKIAAYGAQLFPNQHFFADDSYLANTYDFVLASAAIHYVEDWTGIFKKLAGVTKGYLYVTRLPMVLEAAPFVFVQRPYAYGYNTEYVAWCLNRTEFLHEADKLGLTLVREFVIGERPPIANAPERCQYRGFLFRTFPREGTA